MSLIDIIWSADCDGVFIAKRHTTLLPPWADCALNAESVASEICQNFFTDEVWRQWIGNDDTRWTIDLEIHSPASIAGNYEVELERVTKAQARKVKVAGKTMTAQAGNTSANAMENMHD